MIAYEDVEDIIEALCDALDARPDLDKAEAIKFVADWTALYYRENPPKPA